VCLCGGREQEEERRRKQQKGENKGKEMRGRIAARPNCYLNQAATKNITINNSAV